MTCGDTKAKSIFLAALERYPADQWAAYLDGACADDQVLRGRVEDLLKAHRELGSVHIRPAPDPVATTDQLLREGPGTVIGPYKLLEEIGAGGMGVVYMAEQQKPVRRKVALKIVKPGMDTRQVIARFEAERQALALMDHPNIARVLDAGATESSRPYFVMELVKGLPITDYCDRNRLPIADRLELFVQVCQAVQHAHQKGVIHRDLKPSNVLVTMIDGAAVPKVIDFGVAKAMGQQLTERTLFTGFAQLIGTPLYMSPEQAEFSGVDVDTRSDIYALGVLLYELLTGTTPFDQDTFRTTAHEEIRRIIREVEPPKPSTRISTLEATAPTISANRQSDPSSLGKSMRGELDWIVMKALEKDRNRRYETANGLAADVRRYLDDEPVQACPPSAWYRFSKAARRNRVALVTTALVASALVLGTAVSTWQAIRATRAERRALADRNRAEDAERTARTEADKAAAINDFLIRDLLTQADPARNAVADQVTLLEVLDRAAEKVGARFGDRPLVEAALRTTIGETYVSLGAWEKSRQQYVAALTIYERESGPGAAETAHTMIGLGGVLDEWGRYDEAEPLLHQGLDRLSRALGEDHPDTLKAMNNLAHLYWVQETGRTSEAEALLRKVLENRRRVQGEDHPDTLEARNNLAMLYDSRGKLWEAESLFPQGLEIRLGDRSEAYLSTATMKHRAGVYLAQGKLTEAEPLLVEALQIERRVLGEGHPHAVETMLNLVQLYHLEGKLAEAEVLLVRRLQFPRGAGAHKQYRAGLGLNYTQYMLGCTLLRQARYTEAELLMRELDRRIDETHDWFFFACRSVLGGALVGQEKYAEAEPLLLSGYQGLKARLKALEYRPSLKPRQRRRDEAGERIVQLYEAWGQPEKAGVWKATLGLADLPAEVFARP
jgi:serine/threonine protein kinase